MCEAEHLEKWKPIKGYEGYYEISNKGNVRGIKRTIATSNGKTVTIKPKLLKLQKDGNGYPTIMLTKQGIRKAYNVHRIVAEAFMPNSKGLDVVNHINSIKTDNSVENLEWCTQHENLHKSIKYNNYTLANKTPIIRLNDGKTYDSIKEAAKDIHGNIGHIHECCNGKRNHHKGYKFAYINKEAV
jgi:hypothetical protein